eukprot:jgi/Mesen1/5478/ME000276S04614
MADLNSCPVACLELVQPQLGFICGSLPVPLDAGPSEDLVERGPSVAPRVEGRSTIPQYTLLPAETNLKAKPPYKTQQHGVDLFHLPAVLAGDARSTWGGGYLSQPIARKCEALAVSGLATYGDEIDVIAPVEILKQIFKTPYSKAGLSVAVHRVGGTLILNSG